MFTTLQQKNLVTMLCMPGVDPKHEYMLKDFRAVITGERNPTDLEVKRTEGPVGVQTLELKWDHNAKGLYAKRVRMLDTGRVVKITMDLHLRGTIRTAACHTKDDPTQATSWYYSLEESM